MKIRYFITGFALISLLFFIQCKHGSSGKITKIKAKIVNPQTDKVIISQDFLMLHADTLKLIGENELNGSVHTPEEGLFILFVFPEYQTVYLKPNDSLAFHLNVNEFDESISFSGSLGYENNLLMDLFLANEKESLYFYKHKFDFPPEVFTHKIDSFHTLKENMIDDVYRTFDKPSKKFRKIAQLSANSNDYILKETYARKNKKLTLPQNYFNYTQILKQKLADPNVIYMYTFADSYLRRKIVPQQNRQKLNLEIAHIIEKDIADQAFKNNILTRYCQRYIHKNHISQIDTVVKTYFKYLTNKDYQNFCRQIIQSNKRMRTGISFPATQLLNTNKQTVNTKSLFKDKKILLSFWDLKQHRNFKTNLKKLKKLKKLYPHVIFLVVNINQDNFDQWTMAVPKDDEIQYYRLRNRDNWSDIRPFHLSQVYLIDKGQIKQSRLNMYRPDFEKKMHDFAMEK